MARLVLLIPLLLGGAAYVPRNKIEMSLCVYTVSNRKLWTYTLDMEKISVIKHTLDGEQDRLLLNRNLTPREIKKMDRFFGRFHLEGLDKYYINERVHGDSGTVYRIKLNRYGKDVYIYYARPEKVLELNRFINRLLPQQYRLWDEEM